MKVSGVSFIKNAIKYDYPIKEALQSILPICDEVVVAVGQSEDNTRELVKSIDPKIKIIDTMWDETLREGGRVLADETNKALKSVSKDSDWIFYIQGDEVIHEKYHDAVVKGMKSNMDNDQVNGLLFKYLHFYGSYEFIGASSNWYAHEIRVIKNDPSIYSYRDAQGFRMKNNKKLKVKEIDAYIYHYGWVKDPRAMQGKMETFNKLYHDDEWMEKNIVKRDSFDYSFINALNRFEESHPEVMKDRILSKNWAFDFDPSFNKFKFKDKVKKLIEKYLHIRLGYKNYTRLK